MHNIGRKNYLFAGSHEAAQNAAMFYSLLATCKSQAINPQKWLAETGRLSRTLSTGLKNYCRVINSKTPIEKKSGVEPTAWYQSDTLLFIKLNGEANVKRAITHK